MLAPAVTVLYVEDDENDRVLMEIAFAGGGLNTTLHVVNDGQKAIEYLSGSGAYAEGKAHPPPNLVLLDLNLPEVHGFEVLKWLRAQPSLKHLPVVVFSSSDRDEDREQARLLGANNFISKPSSLRRYRELVQAFCAEWLAGRPTKPSAS